METIHQLEKTQTLNKVEKIGEQFCHVFINNRDKSETVVSVTEKEYRSLAERNATMPTLSGHSWKMSVETSRFNTESGFLEKGNYADMGNGEVIINTGEPSRFSLPMIKKEGVVSGKLVRKGLDELKEVFKIELK